MIQFNFTPVLVMAAMAAIAVPVFAQQSPEAAKPSAAPSPAAAPAPAPAPAPAASAQDAEAAAAIAAIAKSKAAAAAAADSKSAKDAEAPIAKKAKEFGWRPEVRRGVTVYCREAPVVGSRFTEKRCANESQLLTYLEQQEYQRDQLKQRGCGGNCGGN
jgi:hypothetical protein